MTDITAMTKLTRRERETLAAEARARLRAAKAAARTEATQAASETLRPKSTGFWRRLEQLHPGGGGPKRPTSRHWVARPTVGWVRVVQGGALETNRRKH